MYYIDSYKAIYKGIKKNNQYHLLLRVPVTKDKSFKYKLECTGKENILKYIKNNGLTPYKEDQ